MPSLVLPTLSASALDDLIYYTRTNDLTPLKELISQLCNTHNCDAASIVTAANDDDVKDGTGCCLLHWPSANGNGEVLNYLLDILASPPTSLPSQPTSTPQSNPPPFQSYPLVNHKNNSGNTPLHWAAFNSQLSCVKVLVSAGADPSIKNDAGHDTIYEAERGIKAQGPAVEGEELVGEIVGVLLRGLKRGRGEGEEKDENTEGLEDEIQRLNVGEVKQEDSAA